MIRFGVVLVAGAFLLAACGGPDAPASSSISVQLTRTTGDLQAALGNSAAATEAAQNELDRIAAADASNRVQSTQIALVETQQAQAQQWIAVTQAADQARLEAERAAITNTLAIREAEKLSEAEIEANRRKAAELADIELAAARAEADQKYWSGLLQSGGAAAVGVALFLVSVLLIHFVWTWYTNRIAEMERDNAHAEETRRQTLPGGAIVVRVREDPYNSFYIEPATEDGKMPRRLPTWEALGLPAPQYVAAPEDDANGDMIRVKSARRDYEIPHAPIRPPDTQAVIDFLKHCATQVGGRSPRIPSADDYVERWGGSKSTWQKRVDTLVPQFLESRGKDGTFCASVRFKNIESLIRGIESGEIKLATQPRKATVPADQVEILTPSASD